jgi:hypothetical protein
VKQPLFQPYLRAALEEVEEILRSQKTLPQSDIIRRALSAYQRAIRHQAKKRLPSKGEK